jgi:hypothetical protein
VSSSTPSAHAGSGSTMQWQAIAKAFRTVRSLLSIVSFSASARPSFAVG